jgi:hypothetical protein
MPRLLVLCRLPYHLPPKDAEAWLTQELETVLQRDGLEGATLTRLGNPSAQWTRSFDWMIEFHLAGLASAAMGRGGACAELLADLRMLGMAPAVALVDDRTVIRLQPS